MRTDNGAVSTSEWLGQSGQSWAQQWRRTDRGFSMLTERLLRGTREFSFSSALDIGCGAGELSLAIARGRPQCRVIGVDISPPLIEVARERGSNLRDVVFELADAATWQPAEPFAPELLVSRHGVMFFDDPVSAFTHLRELAAPGAGLMFSCFRDRDLNPALTDAARLLPDPPPPPADPHAPGPFAFADRERVEAILTSAGWSDIAFEAYDFAMIVGAGADPVEDALDYFTTIGPAAPLARELDKAQREVFLGLLRDLARRNLHEGIVSLRAAAWIVTARNA
jgi:SAM-dependent methyltransferase